MKEIRFRGKWLKNGDWVYGGYHKHIGRTPCPIGDDKVEEKDIAHLIFQSGFSDWNMSSPLECFKVDPATVGQFTGLCDKNGKEIYEGDICRQYSGKQYESVGKIYWQQTDFSSAWVWKMDGLELGNDRARSLEVIGNIWDNPELAKGDAEE